MTTGRKAAILVFVEVHDETADITDAGMHAGTALRALLNYDGVSRNNGDGTFNIEVEKETGSKYCPRDASITIHHVIEAGLAIGNGYLRADVTEKGFRW